MIRHALLGAQEPPPRRGVMLVAELPKEVSPAPAGRDGRVAMRESPLLQPPDARCIHHAPLGLGDL